VRDTKDQDKTGARARGGGGGGRPVTFTEENKSRKGGVAPKNPNWGDHANGVGFIGAGGGRGRGKSAKTT